MMIFEQSGRTLPKNLNLPLPVQDLEDGGSGDLLSRSLVHADDRDEIGYDGGIAARKRKKI